MSSSFFSDWHDIGEFAPVGHFRVFWKLHPALSYVLNRLEGTAMGQAFTDRAVEASVLSIVNEKVDYEAALKVFRWVLDRAGDDGLPLTAAGYLKPSEVVAMADHLVTMRHWIFNVTREENAYPIVLFHRQLKTLGLFRKYKASLRVTKAGRQGLTDSTALWRHIANKLVPGVPDFDKGAVDFHTDVAVVTLIHAATTEGPIDTDAIARTITSLGWTYKDGTPTSTDAIYPIWNELWTTLANVGEPPADVAEEPRNLSLAARILIHDALFEEVAAPIDGK